MAAELLGDPAAVEKWFRMACQRWAQPKTELEPTELDELVIGPRKIIKKNEDFQGDL